MLFVGFPGHYRQARAARLRRDLPYIATDIYSRRLDESRRRSPILCKSRRSILIHSEARRCRVR